MNNRRMLRWTTRANKDAGLLFYKESIYACFSALLVAFAFTALQCCAIVVQTDYAIGNCPKPPKNKSLKSDSNMENTAYRNGRNFTSDLGHKLVKVNTEN